MKCQPVIVRRTMPTKAASTRLWQAALVGLLAILAIADARGATPRAREPFTVVMLPDTQIYSKSHPALFYAQTEWVKQGA